MSDQSSGYGSSGSSGDDPGSSGYGSSGSGSTGSGSSGYGSTGYGSTGSGSSGYGSGGSGSPGSTPPPYGGGMPSGQQPAGEPPPSNLVWGILTTVLCCLPLGIVSIVYAAQVGGKWASGDVAGAQDASAKAKRYAIIGAVVGLVLGVILVLLSLAGMFAVPQEGTTDL